MLKVLLNIEPQKTKGVVGAPWKTVSKRVKVSSVQLAVWRRQRGHGLLMTLFWRQKEAGSVPLIFTAFAFAKAELSIAAAKLF